LSEGVEMKLLRIDIQDGESQYSEWFKVKNMEMANEIASKTCDGFLRAVRNKEVQNITEKELEVLYKFGVI
tara:strand:+ start:7175 stop:7387 length:213 start_codon:yes stop_codon:yes gene_type:complete